MPVKNKLNELLKVKGINNPYQLRKLTGLGQGTCLKAFDPNWVPNPDTMDVLCDKLDCQPGDFLYFDRTA